MFFDAKGAFIGMEGFSALQRAEIAEITSAPRRAAGTGHVSVLFNEPKLLKSITKTYIQLSVSGFSALQRAEIAEICWLWRGLTGCASFSALQRAEIAEIAARGQHRRVGLRFSALQRAEIAEIDAEKDD